MAIGNSTSTGAWPLSKSAMALRIRNYDWSLTTLGSLKSWSQGLRTLVDLCLANPLASAVMVGPDLLLIYNDACATLLGARHPSALGLPVADGFPDTLSDTGSIKTSVLGGETVVFQARPWVTNRGSKPTTLYVDAYFVPVPNQRDEYEFVQATIIESCSRTPTDKPEHSLLASRSPAAGAILIIDTTYMSLVYASQGFDQIIGGPRGAVIGDLARWIGLLAPSDQAAYRDHLLQTASGPATSQIEFRVLSRRDGSEMCLRQTSLPMPLEIGAGQCVAAVLQDITELQKMAEALNVGEHGSQSVAEGIPNLVWRSCNEGLWTWAGPQWLEYTGQTQEQSRGWGWLDAIHPEDRDLAVRAWHEARPHGALDVTYRVRNAADGSWRWHQTRSLPRRSKPGGNDTQGEIIEWFGSSTDVHELKQLEARYELLVEQHEQQSRALNSVAESLARMTPGPTSTH